MKCSCVCVFEFFNKYLKLNVQTRRRFLQQSSTILHVAQCHRYLKNLNSITSSCFVLRNFNLLRLQQRFFPITTTTQHYSQQFSTLALHNNNNNNNNYIYNNSSSICFINNMGSINCKEYSTTAPNNNNRDSCANQPDNGTTGTYQSKSEVTAIPAATQTTNMPSTDYTTPVTVCHESDIEENQMKQLELNEHTKILLVKQNGQLKAIGNKCSHYGAPLHTGALGQGRVRCPWHGACFNIETGDIEDFPGLDSVPCYRVEVDNDGQVKVSAKRKDLESNKRIKSMARHTKDADEQTFVIVGGGPSGAVCAETLRQEGFTGRIVMLCREKDLPYDRVKISKSMDIAMETIQLRTAAFYEEHSIETMLGVAATKLDASSKTVYCSNGYAIKYDKIYIATGCYPMKPRIKGYELQNIFTVRDHSDSINVAQHLKPEMNVVCLGSSFIAMEAASYMVKKVKSVTVVGRENVPFKASFGEQIGQRVLQLYLENGVAMQMSSGIEEIIGNDAGCVTSVKLKDGFVIPCDLLLMGTGSRFYTEFLQDSGININANGSIDTDAHLMSNIQDIYIGGDIANAPVFAIGNEKAAIGHYQLAQYHGRIAAINMVGKESKPLHAVPFFFSMIFGKGLRYSGYGKYTDVVLEGDLENMKFVAYFLNGADEVIAVASCGRDPIVAQFAELKYQGKQLHRSDIEGQEDPVAWTKKLQ